MACTFELSQKRVSKRGLDNIQHLKIISDFLETSVKNVRENRAQPQYRLRTSSLKSNLILKDYLTRFPLRSSKYQDFLC